MGLLTTQLKQILRMRQISMAVLVSLVAVAAYTSGRSTADDQKKAEAMTENKLVGTWKQIKAKFRGNEVKIPEGTTQLKHVTQTHFMFVDFDKDGVELKVYRLASVSGTVIFQGVVDEQSRERLISSGLAFEVKQTSKRGYPKWSSVTPASDGRFQITGLPPGKLIFYAAELNLVWKPEHYPWQILKVERNGVDVSNGIEIDYGQEIGGFYVVFVEGKGVIEGQVHVAGPALPEDTAISVIAKQDDPVRSLYASLRVSSARVDAESRFVIEGLMPGEYELRVSIYQNRTTNMTKRYYYSMKPELRVSVANDKVAQVTINIDLSKVDQRDR